ncbi:MULTISPECIES: hypothetical protein [unclassified Mesorhizobium]|uniref:hypothetical protein n=1 Tax=unclassified Mesorhizobium TaxID=325217 RepID=UPI0015E35C92|nr:MULTISPECIES: hypothetical protein [unclassified Mesorhizobium]MBZ9916945.1 hypothetical protein [Mesorhizobium sp. BR1-1-7]MBZ9955345.1 hypothetical protein [Mesorhizobium sp. BR1-1-15]MBZ9969256.1 hypothetical protein [Mesorhizobium sp. BR1-1-12]MCA0055056.1 hypothetical protein [Mesorhizobium sp. B261B1A]
MTMPILTSAFVLALAAAQALRFRLADAGRRSMIELRIGRDHRPDPKFPNLR